MTDPNRIDVARVELVQAYTMDGKATTFLSAADFRIGYEADTDKLVVQRKGSIRVHVIPWANVKGFELDTPAPRPVEEAANGRPAAAGPAGGGSRRARPPQ